MMDDVLLFLKSGQGTEALPRLRKDSMKLLKAIIWAFITFFSPQAGLEEIDNGD